jgi:HEAT repeat protein
MSAPLIRILPGLLLLGGAAPYAMSQTASYTPAPAPAPARSWSVSGTAGTPRATQMPRATLRNDPADSLYRAARDAMSRGRFREAADLMRDVRRRYPTSGYVPDSYYWEAYAMSRAGSPSDLRRAASALDQQASKYPDAAAKGDSRTLRAELTAMLARQGDANAAEDMARTVAGAATPVPPVPPTAPAPPVSSSAGMRSPRPTVSPRPPRAPRPPATSRGGDDCGEEDDVQTAALNGLMQMDASRAMPVLEKVLARRDPGSQCLRRRAVFIVAQQAPNAAAILLKTARTDPDAEVRGQAVFWLSQVNSPEAVAALDSILKQSTDPDLREKALFAMSQQESPRALEALKEVASNEKGAAELRDKAVFWLGQRDDPASRAFLRDLYGRTASTELKEKIVFSVAQSGDPAGRTWLLGIAKDPKESIGARKQALFWLGQQQNSATELVTLYGSLTDQEMREQVIFALSQSNEKTATDKLIEVARSDRDPELRKKAIFWLGQSDDPRVADVLEKILTGEK